MAKKLLFGFLALLLVTSMISAFHFRFVPQQDFRAQNFQVIRPANLVLNPVSVLIGAQNSGRFRLICPVNDTFCTGTVNYAVRRNVQDQTQISSTLILTDLDGTITEIPLYEQIGLAGNLMSYGNRVAFPVENEWNYASWKVRICDLNTNNCFNSRNSNRFTIN